MVTELGDRGGSIRVLHRHFKGTGTLNITFKPRLFYFEWCPVSKYKEIRLRSGSLCESVSFYDY